MPNRCENDINIVWPIDDMLKVKSYIKPRSFFNNIKRKPKNKDRYEWNIQNRWTKRDTGKKNMNVFDYHELSNNKAELILAFDTARSPPIEAMEALANKHDKINILLRYSEWWMNFSWEAERDNGELLYHEQYDDYYFGNGKRCTKCDGIYNDERDDDRTDYEHTICTRCWENG